MVKEKASLKQAVPALLVALDEIIVHPSKAQDTGKAICIGKHLAQCTVNIFFGSHQWSMPLMASALFCKQMNYQFQTVPLCVFTCKCCWNPQRRVRTQSTLTAGSTDTVRYVRLMVQSQSLSWRQKGFPPRSVFRSTK